MNNKFNKYKKEWDRLESDNNPPMYFRHLIEVDYSEFRDQVFSQEDSFVKALCLNLYQGDCYLIKNAFSRKFCQNLVHKCYEWSLKQESCFHKMLEGVPDFHRNIDESVSVNYAIRAIKHSCYFFPWNDDPLNIFPIIWDYWSLFKYLGGYPKNAYEQNTPKDGIVDRIQMVCYPPRTGNLETHIDPRKNQRVIVGVFLSTRGESYQTGGFYAVDKNGQEVDLESRIETGDIFFSYPTVLHGVKMVDQESQTSEYSPSSGRWFLGLYSNDTDHVQNRTTSKGLSFVKDEKELQDFAKNN